MERLMKFFAVGLKSCSQMGWHRGFASAARCGSPRRGWPLPLLLLWTLIGGGVCPQTLSASDSVVSAGNSAVTSIQPGATFAARDTLDCESDTVADAQACLQGLTWAPAEFQVQCEAAAEDRGDWLLRFPSPRPLGNPVNDLVSMEWYAARDIDKSLKTAPAVVVIHESGRGMTVGRIIARGLCAQGLHAFLMHLPGYGARRVQTASEAAQMLPALRQGIADARRARDAVTALPCVDASVVGLQGTSLGGFVTATVAGMDRGYDRVFILLAGGHLHDVLLKGARDAAGARERLRAAGITDDQIVEMTRAIEPMRLAHRIEPRSTWLYSGKYDDVVPPACSLALVQAARLPHGHHVELPADHYSGVIYLPVVMQQMYERMVQPLAAAAPVDPAAPAAAPPAAAPPQ